MFEETSSGACIDRCAALTTRSRTSHFGRHGLHLGIFGATHGLRAVLGWISCSNPHVFFGRRSRGTVKTTGRRSMQAVGLLWSSTITIRSWAGSFLHGDRFGLALRARRLHKSRGTIKYFGSSIADGSMAENGTKIPRSRSPEAGCWSTNLNLHGEIWSIFRPPSIEKSYFMSARGVFGTVSCME
jgi:hypothetical protein